MFRVKSAGLYIHYLKSWFFAFCGLRKRGVKIGYANRISFVKVALVATSANPPALAGSGTYNKTSSKPKRVPPSPDEATSGKNLAPEIGTSLENSMNP
jgi:hypothetical protein